jgi:hypothetical protein
MFYSALRQGDGERITDNGDQIAGSEADARTNDYMGELDPGTLRARRKSAEDTEEREGRKPKSTARNGCATEED